MVARSEAADSGRSVSGVPDGTRTNLSAALREATRSLHHRAERSGVTLQILRGGATRRAYATLLQNLLPVYRALEDGLERHRDTPGVRLIIRPELSRATAIAHDLADLNAEAECLPFLPEGEQYARRIADIADGEPVRLIGHAYTRYLGDLSGGRVLRTLLGRTLALPPSSLTLYEFSTIPDPDRYKVGYRRALDRVASEADAAAVIDEAMGAFRLYIALSCAVEAAAGRKRASELSTPGMGRSRS